MYFLINLLTYLHNIQQTKDEICKLAFFAACEVMTAVG